MKITSPAFGNNQTIPAKYTCDGENTSPPLVFSDLPEGTKSLALIMDDPDAPAGIWVHWVVWNIGSDIAEFKAGEVPGGALEGMTSFGRPGYGGPCPPAGTHHYYFKLYALDRFLNLPPEQADKAMLEKIMEGHVLEQAELVGLYSRP